MKQFKSMHSLTIIAIAMVAVTNLFLAACSPDDDYEIKDEYTLANRMMTRSETTSEESDVRKEIDDSFSAYFVNSDTDTIVSNITLHIRYESFGNSQNDITLESFDRSFFSSMSIASKSIVVQYGHYIYTACINAERNDTAYRALVRRSFN